MIETLLVMWLCNINDLFLFLAWAQKPCHWGWIV